VIVRTEPSFTIGIEEEYLLVDRQTRDLALDPPASLFRACEHASGPAVVDHELLRSQVEVDTRVCRTVAEARADLARLRSLASRAAREHGLAILAASTHPVASWHRQQVTDKTRYHLLEEDYQSISRRMLICGTHVHVGIDDDDLRVTLLGQFARYLPLLLALSASSPFWEGKDTGLKCYRLSVLDGFPRSGLPEYFDDFADYQRQMALLKRAGVMRDETFIWWDMRISARYPTLECRIMDMCPELDDAAALAALVQCLLRWLYRRNRDGRPPPVQPRLFVAQNRWRAMRYGTDQGLVDFDTGDTVPVGALLDELCTEVEADADALGCSQELSHLRRIPQRGTSAHRQLRIFRAARQAGEDDGAALRAVIDDILERSVAGLAA